MKTTVKQLGAAAPAGVMEAVRNYADQYHLRNISLDLMPEGSSMYLQEDHRYQFFNPAGEKLSVSVGGEWGGMQNINMIGKRINPPAGSWAVEFVIFCGKPMIEVTTWGLKALPGGN